jgi:hypothetical protein
MFCSSCGNSVAGVQFCAKCGTPVAGATAAPAAPVTPAPAVTPGQPIGSMAYPAAPKTNGMAIASLITSIVCCGPVGIILGIVAKNQIKASRGTQGGDGLATGGIIVGALSIVGGIIYAIVISVAASSSYGYYY